jgi:hypothetical protein
MLQTMQPHTDTTSAALTGQILTHIATLADLALASREQGLASDVATLLYTDTAEDDEALFTLLAAEPNIDDSSLELREQLAAKLDPIPHFNATHIAHWTIRLNLRELIASLLRGRP